MAMNQKNKLIGTHLFYLTIIAAFAIYHSWANQKELAYLQSVGNSIEAASRRIEGEVNIMYAELKRNQMLFPSGMMNENMRQLDTMLCYADALTNDQKASIANFKRVMHALSWPRDTFLRPAVDSMVSSILSIDDGPRNLEHQLLVLKKNFIDLFLCYDFSTKMNLCSDFRQGPFMINLENGFICPSVGDTLLLRFNMMPTAVATEKTFSKIRFSIEDKPINSKGFTGTYPLVADQKGKQQISVKAETYNAWTGQIETYWRTFEWCVN